MKSYWEKEANVIHQEIKFYELNSDKSMYIHGIHADEKKRANEYGLQRLHAAYCISVTAVPYHNKLSKNSRSSTSALDVLEWCSVDTLLLSFVQNGYKGLTVDLIYHYARSPTGVIDSPPSTQTANRRVATTATIGSVGNTTLTHLLAREDSNAEHPAEAEKGVPTEVEM